MLGTELLPSLDRLLPFLLAGIALNLTPGSDMTFVAFAGARGGRAAGMAAAAGIFAGCLGHILLAVVGLSALIAASQTAFRVVQWSGVIYLLFLAVQMLRGAGNSGRATETRVSLAPLPAFRQAAVVNLLNPKVGMFFLAFLPQFLEPDLSRPWLQILGLGLVFNATGLVVNGIVGLSSAWFARRLAACRWLGRTARYLAATLLGGLALRLALLRRD